jgi:hypothetical protein
MISKYRLISLTSVICKHMEHIIASYLGKIWDKKDLLFEGQHAYRLGYSCESQVIMVCKDTADSLDNGSRINAIIIGFSKTFDLDPHNWLLTKTAESGADLRMDKGTPIGSYTES